MSNLKIADTNFIDDKIGLVGPRRGAHMRAKGMGATGYANAATVILSQKKLDHFRRR